MHAPRCSSAISWTAGLPESKRSVRFSLDLHCMRGRRSKMAEGGDIDVSGGYGAELEEVSDPKEREKREQWTV